MLKALRKLMLREPRGAVFHFADGAFIRAINRWHKEPEIVLSLEKVGGLPLELGTGLRGFFRPRHYGAFVEHKNGRRRIWEGDRSIYRMRGRRFPNVYHYFFPEPGLKETFGGG